MATKFSEESKLREASGLRGEGGDGDRNVVRCGQMTRGVGVEMGLRLGGGGVRPPPFEHNPGLPLPYAMVRRGGAARWPHSPGPKQMCPGHAAGR